MRTCWNDAEDDAMQGLPLRAQIIYLRGIRRYMDYQTRISGGVQRRISLTMLAEITQEWLNRQIQPKVSKDSIRASLEQLKRAGLIERQADPDYLVFYLPKADQHKLGQNNQPTTTPVPPSSDNLPPSFPRTAGLINKQSPTVTTTQTNYQPTHQLSETQVITLPDGRAENLRPKRAPPPYQAIVEQYHACLPELPRVYKLTDSRRRRIKALWDDELDDLQSWCNYFQHIRRADFLMGRCPGRDGMPFLATFDFIIHPTKFIKIAEEHYHGQKIQKRNSAG